MISAISNNQIKQNKPTFEACIAKSGRNIETFEEIGHLMDVGLQATVKGYEYKEIKNGFFAFRPAPKCNSPHVYLSEDRGYMLIEKSADDALLITNVIKDSPKQKELFQKTGWKLFSLIPREVIEKLNQAKEKDMVGEFKRKINNLKAEYNDTVNWRRILERRHLIEEGQLPIKPRKQKSKETKKSLSLS